MPSSRTTEPRRTETRTRVAARWRRPVALAATVMLAAAVVGPATANASWSTYDRDTGATEGNGTGSAPPQTASNGDGIYDNFCEWTVTGRLTVSNPTVDGVNHGDPVAGVEVRLSGRTTPKVVGIGIPLPYTQWDAATTDTNGEFSLSYQQCGAREAKIEARFESDDLRTTSSTSPDWYELHKTPGAITPTSILLGDEPFGGETGAQALTQARIDAQTWIVYRKALDHLAAIGQPSLLDVTVDNPAIVSTNTDSWADPVLHEIHIAPANTTSLDNMLHELGHIWAYPREIGEDCLITAVAPPPFGDGSFSTHDQVETPCVAFNEGFADFFSNKLEEEMNSEALLASSEPLNMTTPMNRATLNDNGLVSLSSVATNELGWDQVFRVLTSDDITRDLFGPGFGAALPVSTYTGPSCAGAGMPVGLDDLATALRVIGYTGDRIDLSDSDDPSVADVFDRAADRLAGFDDTDAIAYLNAVDPTLDSEPHDAYGC